MKKQHKIIVILIIAALAVSMYTLFPLDIYDNNVYVVPVSNYQTECVPYPSNLQNWDCVNDGINHDGDSTYVHHTSSSTESYAEDRYNLQSVPTQEGDISSVKVVVYAKKVGTSVAEIHIGLGPTSQIPDEGAELTNTYQQFTKTFYKNPSSNTDWTWSSVANMRIRFQSYIYQTTTSTQVRVTSAYAVINYGSPIPQHTLTVAFDETKGNVNIEEISSPLGLQTISQDFLEGTTVRLTATPFTGYSFKNWENQKGYLISSNPYQFTISEETTLTAHFTSDSFFCSAGGPYQSTSKTIPFSSSVTGGSAPYTYLWDFGDDSTSTEQNPSHTFQEDGLYTVSLTVTDSTLETTTDTTTVTIDTGSETPSFTIFLFIISICIIMFKQKKLRK